MATYSNDESKFLWRLAFGAISVILVAVACVVIRPNAANEPNAVGEAQRLGSMDSAIQSSSAADESERAPWLAESVSPVPVVDRDTATTTSRYRILATTVPTPVNTCEGPMADLAAGIEEGIVMAHEKATYVQQATSLDDAINRNREVSGELADWWAKFVGSTHADVKPLTYEIAAVWQANVVIPIDDAEAQKSNLLRLADAYDALSAVYARCDSLSDQAERLNAESELIREGVAALE